MILSRWPIDALAMQRFTHCAGGIRDTVEATRNDCLAGKGVVSPAVRSGNRRYHVLGTHLDAGHSAADRAAREQQLRTLAAFVRSRTIPADEAVIIAGDLNIERFDPAAARRLGEVLHAAYGPFSGCSPAPLYPTTPAGDSLDLSDHYAVVGLLVFPGAQTAAAVTTANRR
jgi:endonuclease/exonuclease/phosphatase family metal-dependent hydrolase